MMKVERTMPNFNGLPKTVKKTVRYIYQDAPVEKLNNIKKIINKVIEKRLKEKKLISIETNKNDELYMCNTKSFFNLII